MSSSIFTFLLYSGMSVLILGASQGSQRDRTSAFGHSNVSPVWVDMDPKNTMVCPDGNTTCGLNDTCCLLPSMDGWSCCPHTYAACCIDRDGCCPFTSMCCKESGCCEAGDFCCPNGGCCGVMEECCGVNSCCSEGSHCCESGSCCEAGEQCCPGGGCCPEGSECCGDECCPQ